MIAIALRAPEEGALEGVCQAGLPGNAWGSVIAPPHPLYGGSMDSPVVNEVAWASARSGVAAVRFNWRGVGASTGVPSGEAQRRRPRLRVGARARRGDACRARSSRAATRSAPRPRCAPRSSTRASAARSSSRRRRRCSRRARSPSCAARSSSSPARTITSLPQDALARELARRPAGPPRGPPRDRPLLRVGPRRALPPRPAVVRGDLRKDGPFL